MICTLRPVRYNATIVKTSERARGRAYRQAGMATPLALAIVLSFAAVAGAAYFASQRRAQEPTPVPQETAEASPAGEMQKEEGDAMEKEPVSGRFVPTGEVLAGTTTPFVNFNQKDYDQALRENRDILLYFYANWCPICRVELTRTHEAFNELELTNVVGFRVNYNDNETDDFEENLARQFGIAYQHTKVILNDGQQTLKNGETWGKDRYIEELSKASQ